MSDTRAAIRELRSLSEKRSTQGLTEQERSRLAELRERLGSPPDPAEVRPGAVQPSPATHPSAPATPFEALAPGVAAPLPRLDAAEPAPISRFEADAAAPTALREIEAGAV